MNEFLLGILESAVMEMNHLKSLLKDSTPAHYHTHTHTHFKTHAYFSHEAEPTLPNHTF